MVLLASLQNNPAFFAFLVASFIGIALLRPAAPKRSPTSPRAPQAVAAASPGCVRAASSRHRFPRAFPNARALNPPQRTL
jgi:hypothetical protein